MGYAAVFAVSAVVLYGRYLQERWVGPDASGGMYAFGDAILYIFVLCLFMIPTVFLVWTLSRAEGFDKTYFRLLLALSLTAPVSLGLLRLGENYLLQGIVIGCACRLLASPFILLGIGVSWLAARLDRAKRLASYAFVIEGVTFATAIALFFLQSGPKHP